MNKYQFSLLAKRTWRIILSLSSCFFALLGIFWTIIKYVDYEIGIQNHPRFFDSFGSLLNKYNLWVILGLFIISVVYCFNRSKIEYVIKNSQVKITFRKKNVLKGKGYRVIESSSTFCIFPKKTPEDSSIHRFYDKYEKINQTNNLRALLKTELEKNGFSPQNDNEDITQEQYKLGCIANFTFRNKNYLFVDSCPYNNAQNKESISDEEYFDFIAQFWSNLSHNTASNGCVCIPIFNSFDAISRTDNWRLYIILKTFIMNVRAGIIPCKELVICVDGPNPMDSDLYLSFARVLDEYELSAPKIESPMGEGMS